MSALRRNTPPPRTPEREKLASAIKRLAEAVAQSDRVSAAQQRLDSELFDRLQPAARKAKQAVDEAKELAPGALIDAVLAGQSVNASLAEAETKLVKASEAVEQARHNRRMLREESERVTIDVNSRRQAVGAAVRSVIAADPAKHAVIAEFHRSAHHTLRLAQILRTMGVVVRGAEAHGVQFRIVDVTRPGSGGNASLFSPDPQWSAAVAALNDDPDAVLPGLPAEDGPDGDAGAEAA